MSASVPKYGCRGVCQIKICVFEAFLGELGRLHRYCNLVIAVVDICNIPTTMIERLVGIVCRLRYKVRILIVIQVKGFGIFNLDPIVFLYLQVSYLIGTPLLASFDFLVLGLQV